MKPTKEQLENLKDKTLLEISYDLRIDTATLSKLFREYGIKKDELRGRSRKPMPPKEDLEKLKSKTLLEIAEVYKTDPTTISRWLKRYNIQRESLQGRHLKVDKVIPSKEELSQHFDKTYKEIALLYNVGPMDVCGWFKYHKMSRKAFTHKNTDGQISTDEQISTKENLKLSLISKILNASDDLILAIHTLLERTK